MQSRPIHEVSRSEASEFVGHSTRIIAAHLASKFLALSLRRLGADFRARCRYSPVLAESFVGEVRFCGTSYRAANWRCVGRTQGRGNLGQWQDRRLPIKSIWVYPLHSRFRQILTATTTAQA